MSRGKYSPEFKAKIVLEVFQGERELGVIAAENNLNPNMVRKWKSKFMDKVSAYLRSRENQREKQKRKLLQEKSETRC